jgi:hypothetical protein
VTGQHKPSTWADTYPAMRTILDTVIKAQRGARRPTADVPSLIRVRRDLGQLDRGTYQPCAQSPTAWSSYAAFRLVREVINTTPLGHPATAAILRLAADLADQNNAARTALQAANGRLDEGATVPVPDALPVWAQRCSCGGQGITHLAAEHHEPIGPVEVDPHAGRACDLCGDYVTGSCPTCAPSAVATLSRMRALVEPALCYDDVPQDQLARRVLAVLDGGQPATAAGNDDTCRIVEIDGEPLRVHSAGEMTAEDTAALAEVIAAARRKYATEHPEAALDNDPFAGLRTGARTWASSDNPDQPLRWRCVFTDSENLDGVALVCTAEGIDDQHAVIEHNGERDEAGTYDCCHWLVLECHSTPLAAYLVALLNADAATVMSDAEAERLAQLADCPKSRHNGLHCDHYQEGDGPCCDCGRPNWCPEGGIQ